MIINYLMINLNVILLLQIAELNKILSAYHVNLDFLSHKVIKFVVNNVIQEKHLENLK